MHRITLYPAFLLVALAACPFLACQKPMAKPPGQEDSKSMKSAEPFTLSLSSGGGFSGLVEGFTLTSQGQVTAWQKLPGNPETTLWSKKGDSDSAIALVESLKSFLAVDLKETGNVTTRISLVLPDTSWLWSKSGSVAASDVPEPFQTWYARAESYCLSLNSKP